MIQPIGIKRVRPSVTMLNTAIGKAMFMHSYLDDRSNARGLKKLAK